MGFKRRSIPFLRGVFDGEFFAPDTFAAAIFPDAVASLGSLMSFMIVASFDPCGLFLLCTGAAAGATRFETPVATLSIPSVATGTTELLAMVRAWAA